LEDRKGQDEEIPREMQKAVGAKVRKTGVAQTERKGEKERKEKEAREERAEKERKEEYKIKKRGNNGSKKSGKRMEDLE